MHKSLTLAFLSLWGFFSAQVVEEKLPPVPIEKANIIKTNATAYAFRNFNLTYERIFSKTFSLSAGYSTMPEGKVPFIDYFASAEEQLRDVEVSHQGLTLEGRFYVGKKGYGEGFYLAPYARHGKVDAPEFIYYYTYSDALVGEQEIPLTVRGDASGLSGGLLLGTQFLMGKKKNFVLDLWILGVHYGGGSGDFSARSPYSLNQEQQNQLKRELEELDIPMVKYTVTTNPNGADVAMDGPWAGLRSGLSLGFKF
ncbi:DUF3575 domain-containing protein [Planobacterium oryzisoli]|uniref:DUF3575 domain-containing protein n=1 Tax=Planobacterium oryzisoli TaxID=2771435 RepID=UPI001E4D8EAE|nr:DUF3575 domain-containing protein [Planobacterium oryzisoli]